MRVSVYVRACKSECVSVCVLSFSFNPQPLCLEERKMFLKERGGTFRPVQVGGNIQPGEGRVEGRREILD